MPTVSVLVPVFEPGLLIGFNLRLRSRLGRRDDRSGLEALAAFESSLRARAGVVVARPHGDALPPGRYDVRVTIPIAGFAAEAAARVDGTPFAITASPTGRVTPSHRVGGAPRPSSRLGRLKAWIHTR